MQFVGETTIVTKVAKRGSVFSLKSKLSMLAMVFQKCAKVVSRKVGDELIIVPLSTSAGDITSLFSINQTGAFIWENIDGTKTVREIKEKIIGEFKVADQEALTDLIEFMQHLEASGLIEKKE